MSYIHTKCGGVIDDKKKQCTKCNRKWGWLSFYFNFSEMRPAPQKLQKRIDKANKKFAKELARIKKQGGSK